MNFPSFSCHFLPSSSVASLSSSSSRLLSFLVLWFNSFLWTLFTKNNKNLIVLGLSWCLFPSFLLHCESDCTECLSLSRSLSTSLDLSRLSWGLLDHHLSEILASVSICGSRWGWPVATQLWRRDSAIACPCLPFLHTAEIRPQSRV